MCVLWSNGGGCCRVNDVAEITADGQGCCSGDGVVIKAASGNGCCRKDDVAQKIADGGGSWTNVVPNVSWHPAELFSVTGDASTSF